MRDNWNYLSEEELEQLIHTVEQTELVTAPPDLMEEILRKAEKKEKPKKAGRKKEYYAYCFRVITSVAAAIAIMFLLPEVSGMTWRENAVTEAPSWAEAGDTVPSREEIVKDEKTPTKEEVLDDRGFLERVWNGIGWFDKEDGK